MNSFSFLRPFKFADSLFSARRKCRGWAVAGTPALAEMLEDRRMFSTTIETKVQLAIPNNIVVGSDLLIVVRVLTLGDVVVPSVAGTVTFSNLGNSLDPNFQNYPMQLGGPVNYNASYGGWGLSTSSLPLGRNDIAAHYSGGTDSSGTYSYTASGGSVNVDIVMGTPVATPSIQLSAPIVLYNPPGSAEPFQQTATATITNNGTAEASFDVSVHPSGSGNASLSDSSVTLAGGASMPITITPTAVSSGVNDVEIRVYSGDSFVAYSDMTVVSVTIPKFISAADTPKEMLYGGFTSDAAAVAEALGVVVGDYRIPPRVASLFNVMVTPNLGASGQDVTLAVTGQSATNGTVLIDGTADENIISTQPFDLTGGTQTVPGSAGGLKLTVQVGGQNTIESYPFSVAAIPQNVSFVMPNVSFVNKHNGLIVLHGTIVNAFGFVVNYGIQSDSGVLGDILGYTAGGGTVNPVSLSEQIQPTYQTGIFKAADILSSDYKSVADTISPKTYDYHMVPLVAIDSKPHTGILQIDQTFTFNDDRTGAQNIPVPNSGFKIEHLASYSPSLSKAIIITTSKEGRPATANGFASFAGIGSEFIFQLRVPGTKGAAAKSASAAKVNDALTPLAAGAPAQLAFMAQPPASTGAGTGFGLTVQAEDSTGAVASGFNGAITLRLNNYTGDPTATFGGTLALAAVNGVATFTGLTLDKPGNYSITATAAGLTGQTSSAFNITALPATRLVIVLPTGKILKSSPFTIDAAAVDASGNVDATFNGMITLSLSSNPGGATLGGTLSVAAVNGVATFPGVTLDKPGSGYVIQASGDGFAVMSSAFDENTDQLSITAQPPASVAPGVGFGVTVSAENAAGTVDTSYNGVITIALDGTLTGPGVTLAGAVSLQAVSGVANFSGLTMTNPGQYRLIATGANAAAAKSQFFDVSAVATQLVVITPPPVSVTAGAGFGMDVAAEDANGNVDTSFGGNVTVALAGNPGGGTLGGTVTVAAVNGIATFTSLTISGPANGYTVTASANGLTAATTGAINVLPVGKATQLVVTTQPPATLTAGATVSLVVKAEDSFGTIDSSFNGSVTVSDPGGVLAGTLSVNAIAGVATFSTVRLDAAGSGQMLSVDATGLAEGLSNAITVNPAPATQMSVSGPSQNALSGSAFGFDVLAVDSFGNVDPNYTGAITLALMANPSGSTLGGTLTVNAVAGDASFTNLTISNVGMGYTLRATGAGLSATTSAPFDVTADQLVVTTPLGRTIPLLGPQTLTVAAEEGSGIVDPSFTGAVTVSLVDQGTGTATLGGTLTVDAVAGVATFSGLTVDQTGDYSLLFTTTGVGQGSSGGFTVTPRLATTTTLTASASSVSFDNPVTLTATVSSAAGGSTGAGMVTFLSGSTVVGTAIVQNDGTAVVATSLLPSGADSVTATFAGNGNFLPSTSSATSVTVGPPSTATPSLAKFAFPAVAVAGQPIKTNLPVVITNGGADLKGPFTVVLFIDASSSLDGNRVQVGRAARMLSLKSGKSTMVPFHVRSLPASLPSGTYYFLADITDPTGATDVAASTSLTVQAPIVTLNTVGGPVKPPGVIKLNHFGTATVIVTDTGNVDAVGMLNIVLSPSSDGATPVAGITLGGLNRSVHLHRGKPTAFSVRFKVTAALPANSYQSYFSVSIDGAVNTAVGTAFTAGG